MRTALGSRMTENTDTIIDTEPRIPNGQVTHVVVTLTINKAKTALPYPTKSDKTDAGRSNKKEH